MFGRVLNVIISIMSVIISATVKYQLFGIAKNEVLVCQHFVNRDSFYEDN